MTMSENSGDHTPRKDDEVVALPPLDEPKRREHTSEPLDVEKAFVARKNGIYSALHGIHFRELQHDVTAFGILSECYFALETLLSRRDSMASIRLRTMLYARRVLAVGNTPYGYWVAVHALRGGGRASMGASSS
jgi:hypothetical protein